MKVPAVVLAWVGACAAAAALFAALTTTVRVRTVRRGHNKKSRTNKLSAFASEDYEPVAGPIASTHRLTRWPFIATSRATDFLIASEPLRVAEEVEVEEKKDEKRRARILVCHDMQGGYGDDAHAQGGDGKDVYRFWHWQLVDVFVYFSHSLVTIPPAGWTNAAHRHGVRCLGAFVAEHDRGKRACETVFRSKHSARHHARQLAALARFYNFDGWLINIEVPIAKKKVPNVIEFLRTLSTVMQRLIKGAEVVWYDAVTSTGELAWQDRLTALNRPFFDADPNISILLNYTWKEGYPEDSARLAGPERAADVFLGSDVFGRGTISGGKWATGADVAAARRAGLSSAIFAPGWVYECGAKDESTFTENQENFWGKIAAVWGGPKKPCATVLPFISTFDQGVGDAVYIQGKSVSSAPWHNLSCQTVQPSLLTTLNNDNDDSSVSARVDFGDAFEGGASLLLAWKSSTHGDQEKDKKVLLFDVNFAMAAHEQSALRVSYAVKCGEGSKVSLQLVFVDSQSCERSVTLSSPSAGSYVSVSGDDYTLRPTRIITNNIDNDEDKNDNDDSPSSSSSDWQVRYHCVPGLAFSGCHLRYIYALCSNLHNNNEARIGMVSVAEAAGHVRASSVYCKHPYWTDPETLSVTLGWDVDVSDVAPLRWDVFYHLEKIADVDVDGDSADVGDDTTPPVWVWLGAAFVPRFRVSRLRVPSDAGKVVFGVQALSYGGAREPPLAACACTELNITDN